MSNTEYNSYVSKPGVIQWLAAEGGGSPQELDDSLVELPVEDNRPQFELQGDFLHPDTFLESENFPDIAICATQQGLEECPAGQAQEGEYGSQTQFDILHTIDGIIPAAPAEIPRPTTEWQGAWVPQNSTPDVQGKRKAEKRSLEQAREYSAEPAPSSHTKPRPTANRSLKRRRTSTEAGPVTEPVCVDSACAGSSSRFDKAVTQEKKCLTKTGSRKRAQGEKAKTPPQGNANSHLTPEEKRKIRAERNRESAEKSRMRQKKKTEELESDVYELRKQNRGLMETSQELSAEIEGSLKEIRESVNKGDVIEDTVLEKVQSLREALALIKQAEENCPWTFQESSHEQEIPLNLKPSPQQPGSPQ